MFKYEENVFLASFYSKDAKDGENVILFTKKRTRSRENVNF